MIYKAFQDLKLSALGLGCMRLPLKSSSDADIDVEATQKMVDYAMAQGVNYYDTAWGYHDGHSETVIGEALKKHPRESFYLASKFPGYDLANMPKVKEIFPRQLEKCQVEYFDFYLFHNVCEMNIDAYLDEKYGIMDYLREQKRNGRIRHLGFSAHGSYDVMKRFLEAYGEEMEFCQIQLNYIDWHFQDAEAKVQLLQEYHLPVWVMEPLRGGRLAKLDGAAVSRLQALRPDETVPAWAFRFLQTVPGVTMVLSGMSSFDQLKDNIETFSSEKPLNEKEMAELLSIADAMARAFPAPPAITAPPTARRSWTFLLSLSCTMSMSSPAAALSLPWRSPPFRRRSSPPPASAAEAVSRSVRSRSKSPRSWRTSRKS